MNKEAVNAALERFCERHPHLYAHLFPANSKYPDGRIQMDGYFTIEQVSEINDILQEKI